MSSIYGNPVNVNRTQFYQIDPGRTSPNGIVFNTFEYNGVNFRPTGSIEVNKVELMQLIANLLVVYNDMD